MRDKLWSLVRRGIPVGQIIPTWALCIRCLLYPMQMLAWKLGTLQGYQIMSDTWLIHGIRYSRDSLRDIAKAKGELYRITEMDGTLIFERVYEKYSGCTN